MSKYRFKNWNQKRLGTVTELLTDGTHFSPKTIAGRYKYLTSKNVRAGHLDLSNVTFISDEEHQQIYSRCPVRKGDLLLTKDGANTGNAALFSLSEECSLLSSIALIRGKKSILHNGFLLQLILSDWGQKLIRSEIAGQAITRLTLEKISALRIPVPPFEEQKSISITMSYWDKAIENAERLIAAKEKKYLWLSCMLLFGNTNFNLDVSKRTRWFAVPDHWKIVEIGSVAKEIKVTNGSGESITVLSCTKYDGLVNSLEYFGKQVFSLDTSTYKVVLRGQFVYATNHIEEGSIGYQNLHEKGLVSPMYTVFETGKNIDDGYLYKVLKTETYRHIFQVNTSASVDRRGSLRWNEFAKLPIPLPPIDEQQRISESLNTARQEIDLLKKQAEAFRKQKRGLMQKLLTGEWGVRVG